MFVQEDGYFSLSSMGYVAFILLLLAAVAAVGFFPQKKHHKTIPNKAACFFCPVTGACLCAVLYSAV